MTPIRDYRTRITPPYLWQITPLNPGYKAEIWDADGLHWAAKFPTYSEAVTSAQLIFSFNPTGKLRNPLALTCEFELVVCNSTTELLPPSFAIE